SVPSMTATLARAAAVAISDQARSRNCASEGGITLPMPRYPGTKHSGKHTMAARCLPACSTASVASTTDCSGVAGNGMLASAIRTVLIGISDCIAQVPILRGASVQVKVGLPLCRQGRLAVHEKKAHRGILLEADRQIVGVPRRVEVACAGEQIGARGPIRLVCREPLMRVDLF